jgi:hypothetical protein
MYNFTKRIVHFVLAIINEIKINSLQIELIIDKLT